MKKDNNTTITGKNTIKNVAKYVCIFLLLLVLANATLDGAISPFAFAMLFALMWCNQNVLILAVCYMASMLAVNPTFDYVIMAGCTVGVLLMFYCLHKIVRKPMNVWLVGVYALLSQAVYIYDQISGAQYTNAVIYVLFGLIFLYACINVLQVLFIRGMYYKFTLDESICAFMIAVVIAMGLAPVVAYEIELGKIVAVFCVLFLLSIGKQSLAIKVALAFGLGIALQTGQMYSLANLSLLTLCAGMFTMPNRVKSCVAVVLADLAMGLYFVAFDYATCLTALSSCVACVLFLTLPSHWIYTVSDRFYITENEISMRNVINITRKNIHKRMHYLSEIFDEMKQIHLAMCKSALTKSQVVAMLTNEIVQNMCGDCMDKNKCLRSFDGGKNCINNLIDIALKKGKITLLDLPSALTSRCNRVTNLVSKVNQIVSQYSQYSGMLNNVNNVKTLLAEQMGAVSKLLLDIGDEVDKNITYDTDMESKIMNKLLAENIVCSEVVLYKEKYDTIDAMLVVKGENSYSPVIPRVVSEVCKCGMRVDNITPTENMDFMSVQLTKANKYDIVFGMASKTKASSDVSGDCHSLLRLGNNKFLLALCDGMGSGQKAENMSALTLGLIENFYKAGFDNELILDSVNKLLAINEQESYSALDICVIDLENEIADFIKLGAPYGIIKHVDSVEKISGGALPIGILESVAPTVHKSVISTQDIIIMATDGITDSFENIDNFIDFVNGTQAINPQTLAQLIVDEATRRNANSAKDDMTVLVARTYLKNAK